MYILEGNIGVGKSTFLNKIKENLPEIKIITEPVNNWTNQVFGQSLLENFYKDTSRWAYTLENMAMIHRVKDHIEIQNTNNPKTLMERSIYSGHYCFAKNSYQNGHLSPLEWEIYNKWTNFLLKNCQIPNGFIYLQANIETCFDRIKKRNRLSEKKITLTYIKQIQEWHDKFLLEKQDINDNLKNVPVLLLDCNQDFENNIEELNKHIYKIKNFITITSQTEKVYPKNAFFEHNF